MAIMVAPASTEPLRFPRRQTAVPCLPQGNLAPADLPKQAASFDLPITLGVLAGSGQLVSQRMSEYALVGELALDVNELGLSARAHDKVLRVARTIADLDRSESIAPAHQRGDQLSHA